MTAVATTLARVVAAMAPAREPWWVIGSAAVMLHGGETSVADVDVLCGEGDALTVIAALGGEVIASAADPVFRSAVFGRCAATSVPVEVMAGLTVRGAPVRLATREWIGGVAVPSRGELATLLRTFGREKDLARAALLLPEVKRPGSRSP